MEEIMKLKEVTICYDSREVIHNIDLNIPKNSITAIIGPSGCGKTTLLKSMNRMLDEEKGAKISGEITLEGQNINSMSLEYLRKKVGLVFQTPSPFPFSILKNMTYAPKYFGIRNKKTLVSLAEEKLKMAGLYDEVKDELSKSALKLSGGQQQRLCIARALTVEPSVLLLDEPCSALDVKSISAIEEMLLKLKESFTIVIVTHNIFQAKRISDYTVFMYNGSILEYGPTEKIFESPQHNKTKAFLDGIYG